MKASVTQGMISLDCMVALGLLTLLITPTVAVCHTLSQHHHHLTRQQVTLERIHTAITHPAHSISDLGSSRSSESGIHLHQLVYLNTPISWVHVTH